VAFHARYFLNTFVKEYRAYSKEPDFEKRLRRKLKKFDARPVEPTAISSTGLAAGALAASALPVAVFEARSAAPEAPSRSPQLTAKSAPTNQQKAILRTRTPIPPALGMRPIVAPSRSRQPTANSALTNQHTPIVSTPTPVPSAVGLRPIPPATTQTPSHDVSPAIAGPGPTTEFNRAIGYGNIRHPVPIYDGEMEEDELESDGGGVKDGEGERKSFADVDAEGEDDPDAMVGVAEGVEWFLRRAAESDVEMEDATKSGDKGKGKAREPTGTMGDPMMLSASESDSDWGTRENKVIVSRPPKFKPTKMPAPTQQQRNIRPTGRYFDEPCSRCVVGGWRCEKDERGGSCIACKQKKQRCTHSNPTRRGTRVKSKAFIDSDDDDEHSAGFTTDANTKKVPKPEPTRQAPSRKARTKAKVAIRAAVAEDVRQSAKRSGKKPRRRSVSGGYATSEGKCHHVSLIRHTHFFVKSAMIRRLLHSED